MVLAGIPPQLFTLSSPRDDCSVPHREDLQGAHYAPVDTSTPREAEGLALP